ncbi:APC family permease [Lactobacillus rodentium]|uniref:Amino acid permease n=1 Tax=Lactobacillus rodentium TaxID=947835 RepID=A0A2Z6T931_9LACO|nr:APC family permease [Lactobacillus rodentium]MCR1893942.1 APC family permease [Lactobacillus rodentium]GBG04193.1 amino acid permease [Lactobacillus rodentium]
MGKSVAPTKKLSFISIFFLGINAIIGSGAFLLPKYIYHDMNLMSVVVLLCAALTVSMIALCYADLSSRFTGSGAAWLYSYYAFGRFAGYELGLFTWFLTCCTYAAEVVAFVTTLRSFVPAYKNDAIYFGTAIGLIVLFTIINFYGRKLVKFVDNTSSVAKLGVIVLFIVVGVFFMHWSNFSPVMPHAATTGVGPFFKHFGAAFSEVFYLFTGFSFIPIAARQMQNPTKNIPRVLISVMITVTILYALTVLIGIGIIGSKMSDYTAPIANAFGKAVGEWGYIVIIIGMLLSIFGVAFISSFNAPSLVASLAEEHNLVPQWVGKKNKYKAPWIAIIMSAIITALLTTQSYIFLVSCIVLASFVQYVPSIFAVMKFKHNGQYPNKGFKLPGGYLIPVIALLVSCYLVFNFTWKTFFVGIAVAVIAALLYLFSGRKRKDPNPGVAKNTENN